MSIPTSDTEDALDPYDEYYDFDPSDRDWVRVPRPVGMFRKVAALLSLFVLGAVLVVGAGGWWVLQQINPPGDAGPEKVVVVADGATTAEIATQLEDESIVANSRIFREYLRFRDEGPFQAGEYTFLANSSMNEAIEVLNGGPALPDAFSVTVPEGLTIKEISFRLGDAAPQFSAQSIQLVANSGQIRSPLMPEGTTNLEGMLFPDTYQVGEDEKAVDVLQRMVDHTESVVADLGYSRVDTPNGLTPYELIVIASLIEREARLPEDQAKISRVIHNRIAEGMKLEIDATVIYAIGERKAELTQEDLDTDSPYNTRLYPGLPPTPIASPGRAALEAAINPAEGDWLFYVLASEDGAHFFTADYDAFLRQKEASKAAGIF